ncbi:pyruvate carboxylase subunit B [Thiogranum longum]|uniref:Pyruvate carboxylase subunit B n=1 Tax=Thiogranum longum TaxID=1537524 RepID=A0A4R1HDR2_9GAMM|nr:sodium-extruding oxaloacetate decarboxylase subunit alpha [Thiogranum longum]TCK18300.1 pyruvate carboxylase subunit B [Thiogranum longum]
MSKVNITDVILRDAHQSLIATRMRTEDMLPVCERLDRIGYWSLEVWGGATFDACIRYLKEDPWERLRKLRGALPRTQLQMLLRGQNLLGYRHYSDDVVRAFIERAADNGIDVFRIFDALNDIRNMETSISAVRAAEKHAQGAICYTTSPVHGIEQFVTQARQLEELGCNSIVVKDMAGLLTPMTTAELFGALTSTVSLPVHLHMHATAGVAEMCHLKAIENGCRHIDTAISAFSGGASHPPTESMVAALSDSQWETGLDLKALQEIGFYFREVRKKYHQFESEMTGLDTRVQVYQVPGGMISNLHTQLREQGSLNRIEEVLQEIPRVRKDLGYPPLVTPTSQIVGAQAVLNVLTGERYKTISNEVKLYLQGRYGRAPGKVNSMVRQQAIGNEDVIDIRPADLLDDEMDELREETNDITHSEEDVLTYAMFPDIGREFLTERNADILVPEPLEPIGNGQGSQPKPTEFNVTLHGETYHIQITGTGHPGQQDRPFYMTVDGVPEEVLVETLSELETQDTDTTSIKGSRRRPATNPGDVATSMPGTVIDVLVNVGDKVSAGDPVLITEAMKMETEIQAPVSGTVNKVLVAKGDSVNPDEALIEISA